LQGLGYRMQNNIMSVFSVAVTLLLTVLAKVSSTFTIAHTSGMNNPLALNIKQLLYNLSWFWGPSAI